MKSKLLPVLIALVVGLVGGQIGNNFLTPAYAASKAIVLEIRNGQEVANNCDFNKSIAVIGGAVVCMQK